MQFALGTLKQQEIVKGNYKVLNKQSFTANCFWVDIFSLAVCKTFFEIAKVDTNQAKVQTLTVL